VQTTTSAIVTAALLVASLGLTVSCRTKSAGAPVPTHSPLPEIHAPDRSKIREVWSVPPGESTGYVMEARWPTDDGNVVQMGSIVRASGAVLRAPRTLWADAFSACSRYTPDGDWVRGWHSHPRRPLNYVSGNYLFWDDLMLTSRRREHPCAQPIYVLYQRTGRTTASDFSTWVEFRRTDNVIAVLRAEAAEMDKHRAAKEARRAKKAAAPD